jgi:hypothetical protein
MSLAVIALTVAVAIGKDRLVARIRPLAYRLNRLSGWLLMAAGVFIVWYWATVLATGAASLGSNGIRRLVERIVGTVSQIVSERPLLAGAAVLALALIGLALRRSDTQTGG